MILKSDTEECRFATADGASRRDAGTSSPGEPEAWRLQRELEVRTRELDEVRDEVRRLRAFLSHGLRQPLAALTIWAELLNAKQAAALDEQGQRYLRELTASVHRVAGMLSSEVQRVSAALPELGREEPRCSEAESGED